MKKEIIYYLYLSLASGLLCACEADKVTLGPAQLGVESTEINVSADNALVKDPFAESTPAVTDTLWVNASRSWTAKVETADGGDWIRTHITERINVTGQFERVPLVVSFDRYRGSQPRKATLTLYGADVADPVVVTYTQEAFSPKLELAAQEDNVLVPAVAGDCYALVKSNTSWTASIDEAASTVVPSLSATAGMDSQAILLTFPDNVDDEKAHVARLVVRASGCPVQTLDFIQTQSDRYFMLAEPVPEKMEPYDCEITIPLRSNGPWTAELSDCTFDHAQLLPSSGVQALDGFRFRADHGGDPEVAEKHATITISREGMEPIVVNLSQCGSIHLNFMSFNSEYEWGGKDYYSLDAPYRPYSSSSNPFSSPVSFPSSYSSGVYAGTELECITRLGSYTFILFGQDCGAWLSPNELGLGIGKRKGDYIQFPDVEGHRLVAMYYEASCKVSVPYTVRDEEGAVISGGEAAVTKQIVPLVQEHHDMHVHWFPETLAGEHYRLTLEEDLKFISIKDLCLVYE